MCIAARVLTNASCPRYLRATLCQLIRTRYERAERTHSVNVLIADDEQLCRDILSLYLQGLGCRVHVTTNGDDAIAAFKTTRI